MSKLPKSDKVHTSEEIRQQLVDYRAAARWGCFHFELLLVLSSDATIILQKIIDSKGAECRDKFRESMRLRGWVMFTIEYGEFLHFSKRVQHRVLRELQGYRTEGGVEVLREDLCLIKVGRFGDPTHRYVHVDMDRVGRLVREATALAEKGFSKEAENGADLVDSSEENSEVGPETGRHVVSKREDMSSRKRTFMSSRKRTDSNRERLNSSNEEEKEGGETATATRPAAAPPRLPPFGEDPATIPPEVKRRNTSAQGFKSGGGSPALSGERDSARKLKEALRRGNIHVGYPNTPDKWEGAFRRLRDTDYLPALEFYCSHTSAADRKKFGLPTVSTAREFEDRFGWIDDIRRKHEEPSAQTTKELSEEARTVLDSLANSYWPMGSEEQLPSVVTESLDYYGGLFYAAHKLKKDDGFGEFLAGRMNDPVNFVIGWFQEESERVANWEGWSGTIAPLSHSNKRFHKWGKQMAVEWSGRHGDWNQFLDSVESLGEGGVR